MSATRVAIYARFSSDAQSEHSIDDQVRLCRARAEREGWEVVEVYADYAISGATAARPRFQQMVAEARAGRFEVVLAEALDRLSRDQEHIAGFHKQMAFAQVRVVMELKLPQFRGRLAGRDQSFSAMALASYSMGER